MEIEKEKRAVIRISKEKSSSEGVEDTSRSSVSFLNGIYIFLTQIDIFKEFSENQNYFDIGNFFIKSYQNFYRIEAYITS